MEKKSQKERTYCDNRNLVLAQESAEARIRVSAIGAVERLGIEGGHQIGTVNTQSVSLSNDDSVQGGRDVEENHHTVIDNTLSSTSTTNVDIDEFVFTIAENTENTGHLIPWMFQDSNIADLFTKLQQAVTRTINKRLLFIESSIHELLSLSNILLLCTSQHSPLCINIFSEDILTDLNK